MAYAIIETGGKQIRVEPGRFYDIELLSVEPDEKVTIQSVLLVQHNGEITIGQPLVAGATVEGTVMRHFRGRKVLVYKMKPKKKTRKKRGHRQEITRLMINSISLDGSVLTVESVATTETPDTAETAVEPVATTETPDTAETAVESVATTETPDTAETAVESVATTETPDTIEPVASTETPDTEVSKNAESPAEITAEY